MGRYEFRLPDIGEGVAEAEIVAWHVAVGSVLNEDDKLADVMTDKATVEIETPVPGRVIRLGGEVGETVAIGSVLVEIETDDDQGVQAAPGQAVEAVGELSASEAAPGEEGPHPELPGRDHRVLAAPAVRARAADLGIDLAQVRPTVEGRVRHADLDAFIAYNGREGFSPAGGRRADEVVKVIGLRRRIAENMAAAKRHIPHFTYVERYDVTALEAMRSQLNAGRRDRPKLTMLPFLISAICRLIPSYPMLNAHYDDEAGEVTRFGSVHMGMAAQTPGGLMVPVIRDAQDRNIWQLASEITRLAAAAREGTAKSGELSGSTMTITSLGAMGGISTAPVINRPEVAIIGPNAIAEQPMFVRDSLGIERVEKRKLMNISMACDHRVIDGWDAASFAQDLKAPIETHALILAEGLA
jgi:2-oxoisovalerate dehydrogenase E2 component (dihydrolipoyl transacylase)